MTDLQGLAIEVAERFLEYRDSHDRVTRISQKNRISVLVTGEEQHKKQRAWAIAEEARRSGAVLRAARRYEEHRNMLLDQGGEISGG